MAYERKIHNYFMIHTSQAKLIKALKKEQAGILIHALVDDHLQSSSDTSEMDAMTKAIYEIISEQIERETEAYEEVCEKRRISALKTPHLNKQKLAKVSKSQQMLTKAEKEKEKENENEKDKEKEKENEKEFIENEAEASLCLRNGDLERISDVWNALGLTKITIKRDTTRFKMLQARVKEYDVDTICEAIEKIKESSFLKGQNNRSWIISFDWFIRPNNFPKVLEGNYTDRTGSEIVPKHIAIVDTFV